MIRVGQVRVVALLVAMIGIGGGSASAQNGGRPSGVVRDESGAVLPAATVRVIAANGTSHETTSSAAGSFEVTGLSNGQYRLEVALPGFARANAPNIIIVAGSTVTRDVTLRLSASDAVTVTALPAAKMRADVETAPLSVGVIGADEVAASRIDSLSSASDYLPSLRYADFGGRGVFGFLTLRGQTNSQTALDPSATLYVDGVPYSDFYSLDQGLFTHGRRRSRPCRRNPTVLREGWGGRWSGSVRCFNLPGTSRRQSCG